MTTILEYDRIDRRQARGGVVALGFAMTVAVWTVAYMCRMPLVKAPSAVTVGAMMAAVMGVGFLAGRRMRRPLMGGIIGGAISGVLNCLLLGSIFADVRNVHPEYAGAAVALWVGGSVALNAVLGAIGGAIGGNVRGVERREANWKGVFAWTLAVATLPLIMAGGLVTAMGAGLAVPDWPQSFGANMFLLPLSQMQSAANGSIFYEHAHRLMGSLVGFTALGLAIFLSINDRRRGVIILAWVIGVCVLLQGAMGGLRVLYATKWHNLEAGRNVAIVHGVFAQLTFALMVGLATICSRTWQNARKVITPAAQADHLMTGGLVALMVLQLVLGALLRHRDLLVMVHITNAVFVTLLAVGCAIRAWGIHGEVPPVRRAGLFVLGMVFTQLVLGVAALILREPMAANPSVRSAIATTLHQVSGAVLMAGCVTLALWTRRLLEFPAGEKMASSSEAAAGVA